MKICSVSYENDGNINPPLFNLLVATKDIEALQHFHEHGLLHPLAIYNKGIGRVISSIQGLILYIGSQGGFPVDGRKSDLFIKTKEVVESIIAFRDDA